LLQTLAIFLTINNHSFHKSKLISSANYITGGINNQTSSFTDYLNLKDENDLLAEENIQLKNQISQLSLFMDSIKTVNKDSTTTYHQKYKYISGKVIANEYSKPDNFITINRGKNHKLTTEMAVINSKGVIGIIDYTSNSYARVQSILNRKCKINAKFKNNSYFGTLEWDSKDYTIVQLKDIPRQAQYNIGDTIITGGKSIIFPEGIPIGTVLEKKETLATINSINIKLFNDMSAIGKVQIIKNFHKSEIKNLANH